MKRTVFIPALVCALLTSACGGGGGGSSMTPGGGTGNAASGDTTHGTASCPAGNAIFTTSPVALGSILGWDPLGAMEPPGHTFPTDHQYLYFAAPPSQASITVNVVAPANMRIWQVWQESGTENEFEIWIQPCAQIIGRLGSMTSISSDLAAAAGPINQNCATGAYTLCQKSLTYDVQAGQVIGTVNSLTSYALDWWLWDSRVAANTFVDPAQFQGGPQPGFTEANIVPASAYYTATLTPQIDALLGSVTGTRRTTTPLDGAIGVDVPNTAAGHWFNPGNNAETSAAALAPDEVQPNLYEVISLGVSQANISQGGGTGFRGNFTPVTTGLINRAVETVTADGNIYCYTPVVENQAGATGVVVLQLVDASTLKIEVQSKNGGSCSGSQPWAFTANAVTFKR